MKAHRKSSSLDLAGTLAGGKQTTTVKMTPGVFRMVSDPRNLEQQIERQMGCMTGFLQIFDRHQILAGKHLHSTKRLLSSSAAESSSPTVKDVAAILPTSPENSVPAKSPGKHTLPLPVFEMKDGMKTSWKLREAPRLSLDSRATVESKGKLRSDCNQSEVSEKLQRRSPSVVARLMGLEVLPASSYVETIAKKDDRLRRSSSESRVQRETPPQFNSEESFRSYNKPESPRPPLVSLHKKSFFDSQEFFPEPKRVGSIYNEIEKRLRIRGIEEPAKDLETLKQILEALQLKGLLHSKPPEIEVTTQQPRSCVSTDQSPIVIMKPASKPSPRVAGNQQFRSPHSRSISPNLPPSPESISPSRASRDRNLPNQISRSAPESNSASSTPSLSSSRRKPLNVGEGQRSSFPQRRTPSINSSPKPSPRKLSSSSPAISTKNKINLPAEDTGAISCSNSIVSKPLEYTSGRSLLERCDKLLHSIAAITSSAEQVKATVDPQPSPVSVLDSTFLSDDNLASPLPKRGINFNDQLAEWDEDHWNNDPSTTVSNSSSSWSQPALERSADNGDDYAYVADLVRESDLNSGVFAAIEKKHRSAATSPQHRRLLFDTVAELVDRRRRLAPWDAFCLRIPFGDGNSRITKEVWAELRRIQEHGGALDAMEVTRAVIRKDLAAAPVDTEQGWGVSGDEMSSAVLHIERQVFKDLVADTIRELADVALRCRRNAAFSRRKLFC